MKAHFAAGGLLAGALLCSQAAAQAVDLTEATGANQAPAPAAPGRPARTIWQIGSGVSYSNGDYGQATDTEVTSVPFNLRAQRGDWFARAAFSWMSIRGPASVIDAGQDGGTETDATSNTPPGPGMQTRAGFGDLTLTAGRRVALTDTLRLTGDVRLKLPTASETRRLTTGTTDVTLRARLAQDIGQFTLNAGARRRLAGSGGRVVVRDTWGLTGGASMNLGQGMAVGADYNWQQSSFAGNRPNSNLTGYFSAPLTRRLRVTGFGVAGLSTNSADYTVGTSITLRID